MMRVAERFCRHPCQRAEGIELCALCAKLDAIAARRPMPGQLWRLGPAYKGGGQYGPDELSGRVVRLVRALPPADWRVSYDVELPTDGWSWDVIIHEQRLERSERL